MLDESGRQIDALGMSVMSTALSRRCSPAAPKSSQRVCFGSNLLLDAEGRLGWRCSLLECGAQCFCQWAAEEQCFSPHFPRLVEDFLDKILVKCLHQDAGRWGKWAWPRPDTEMLRGKELLTMVFLAIISSQK